MLLLNSVINLYFNFHITFKKIEHDNHSYEIILFYFLTNI